MESIFFNLFRPLAISFAGGNTFLYWLDGTLYYYQDSFQIPVIEEAFEGPAMTLQKVHFIYSYSES